jgi:1-aminocyclopropane-1-carboxylate deaminase/D-cysteine desulfhydrase-like pyridoxal-dependent ACC family enzyme
MQTSLQSNRLLSGKTSSAIKPADLSVLIVKILHRVVAAAQQRADVRGNWQPCNDELEHIRWQIQQLGFSVCVVTAGTQLQVVLCVVTAGSQLQVVLCVVTAGAQLQVVLCIVTAGTQLQVVLCVGTAGTQLQVVLCVVRARNRKEKEITQAVKTTPRIF